MKCALCNNKAISYFEYYNCHFCKDHFIEKFEELFKEKLFYGLKFVENKLNKKIKRVAVGVSGGKDSVNTLYLTKKFLEDKDIEIFAILIDEGIKGYRDHTIEFMKKIAKKFDIDLHIISVKKEFGYSLDEIVEILGKEKACSYCGILRRYYLNKFSRELGADVLILGHNMDDEAQTVLMNFFQRNLERLSRLGDISGVVFDPKFIPRIKPMRWIREKESVIYAILHGFYDVERVECPYVVYSLRHRVRIGLNKLADEYKGIKKKILEILDKYLKKIREKIPDKGIVYCKICGEPTTKNRDICKACELKRLIEKKLKKN